MVKTITPKNEKEKFIIMAEALADQMRGLPIPVIWLAATLAAEGDHPVLELVCTMAKEGRIEELITMLTQRKA